MRATTYYTGFIELGLLLTLCLVVVAMTVILNGFMHQQNFIVARDLQQHKNWYQLRKQQQLVTNMLCQTSDHLTVTQANLSLMANCQNIHLIKQQPTTVINYQVADYINLHTQNIFIEQGLLFHTNLDDLSNPSIIWLTQNTTLELTGQDIFALIIITEGNLKLIGNGRIYGAIIANTSVDIATTIETYYDQTVLQTLSNQYQIKRVLANSWIDY